MLKVNIEVKEVESKKQSVSRCDVQSSITGHAQRCETIAMASAMGKLFAALVQTVPDLSGALYDAYADALKKELGA